MQTKSKHTQLLAAALTIALLLAGILTLLHGMPLFRADAAEAQSEEANVYADWKFSEENSSGSLENNTLVIEDASGKDNDLEIVTSENGAKASDFLAFDDGRRAEHEVQRLQRGGSGATRHPYRGCAGTVYPQRPRIRIPAHGGRSPD